MNGLKIAVFGLVLFLSAAARAEHSPAELMRNVKAYALLGETGQLGPFAVNVARFGTVPSGSAAAPASADLDLDRQEDYDRLLADKFNLAAIILKQGKIVYERYHSERGIDANSPLVGMSMSKTALAASLAVLVCDGRLASLDDPAGKYSEFLATTPFANIAVRDILQMNSGVSQLGRADEKKFNQKARGMGKFEGQASVRQALNFYRKPARPPGEQMNYHSTDSMALSVLVEELAGMPVSQLFHDALYAKFGQSGYMHWTSDGDGTTITFSDLVMTARDWANFGQFLMNEKKQASCLGRFFNEGMDRAVATGKTNGSRYGYQSWVFDVADRPTMVLQGHGGQFMVLDEAADTLLLLISVNEQYSAGNLFSHIHEFAAQIR